MQPGRLVLENGRAFDGLCPTWQQGSFFGEVVFTTGMCGYLESLTDPSYAGQILVFTYPLIGNYGIPLPTAWESAKIQVAGVVVNISCEAWSHHGGASSLGEWLEKEGVPLLTEVDTRSLTKFLRTKGTMYGAITSDCSMTTVQPGSTSHLVEKVSISTKTCYGEGKKRVIVVDCGLKESMLRTLSSYPLELVRVPHDYDYTQEDFDGVYLSSGPGDPTDCAKTIAILKKAMTLGKPIFGVCLGSQMLALAAEARTYKLPFGHRGHNQPCIDLDTNRCYITSQNHGYAVDESSLPEGWRVTFRNLNDGSVEGIAHNTLPFYSVQFHPEACPGPTDTRFFFDRFWQCLENAKSYS